MPGWTGEFGLNGFIFAIGVKGRVGIGFVGLCGR
jgi:hypothetical protein